jgi:methionine-rich copper-binding protein CopC
MVATLPSLQSGQYRVQWSTVTHDGHKTRGEFSFRVR